MSVNAQISGLTPGLTTYYLRLSQPGTGFKANTTSNLFESYNVSNIAQYRIDGIESSPGTYLFAMPAWIATPGTYPGGVYQRASSVAAAATSDLWAGSGEVPWDGVQIVVPGNLATWLGTAPAALAAGGYVQSDLERIQAATFTYAGSPPVNWSSMSIDSLGGVQLAPAGIDRITTTEPDTTTNGAMSTWNFRQLTRWGVMALSRVTRTGTTASGTLAVNKLAGTPSTSQTAADDGAGGESLGPPV